MAEDKDWFDNFAEAYIEPDIKKRNIPSGWYGKNNILNTWEFFNLDVDDLDGFDDLTINFNGDYWNIDGLETEGMFFQPEGTENLYVSKDNEEIFMFDFGDRKVIFNVYQIENVYKKKKVITLKGWETDIIIDLDDKTIEEVNTR